MISYQVGLINKGIESIFNQMIEKFVMNIKFEC